MLFIFLFIAGLIIISFPLIGIALSVFRVIIILIIGIILACFISYTPEQKERFKKREKVRLYKKSKKGKPKPDWKAIADSAVVNKEISKPAQDISLADELAKLAQLKEKGFITEEEFANHKAKLLAKN